MSFQDKIWLTTLVGIGVTTGRAIVWTQDVSAGTQTLLVIHCPSLFVRL